MRAGGRSSAPAFRVPRASDRSQAGATSVITTRPPIEKTVNRCRCSPVGAGVYPRAKSARLGPVSVTWPPARWRCRASSPRASAARRLRDECSTATPRYAPIAGAASRKRPFGFRNESRTPPAIAVRSPCPNGASTPRSTSVSSSARRSMPFMVTAASKAWPALSRSAAGGNAAPRTPLPGLRARLRRSRWGQGVSWGGPRGTLGGVAGGEGRSPVRRRAPPPAAVRECGRQAPRPRFPGLEATQARTVSAYQ